MHILSVLLLVLTLATLSDLSAMPIKSFISSVSVEPAAKFAGADASNSKVSVKKAVLYPDLLVVLPGAKYSGIEVQSYELRITTDGDCHIFMCTSSKMPNAALRLLTDCVEGDVVTFKQIVANNREGETVEIKPLELEITE